MKLPALYDLLLLLLFAETARAAEDQHPVWPTPQVLKSGSTAVEFDVQSVCRISAPSREARELVEKACERSRKQWRPVTVYGFGSDKDTDTKHKLTEIKIDISEPSLKLGSTTSEYYKLKITESDINIQAKTAYGALRALNTLYQLAVPSQRRVLFPRAPYEIEDAPRYAHRGILLDTARSFIPVRDIKRMLEAMEASKMNVFHWHIVDSQSFPLQSKALEELAKKGRYSQEQVYTHDDIGDIIGYAQERGIRVIPEIDSPGHTFIWSKAYPDAVVCPNKQPDWATYAAEPPSGQLDPTKPLTYKLVDMLLKEQSEWFTDEYFHLGGDEVNSVCYASQPHIEKYMKEKNMKDVNQLVKTYLEQVVAMIKSKRAVVWEEAVLEYGLAAVGAVQVWKGAANVDKVLKMGLPVIASPYEYYYLDCGLGGWVTSPKGTNSWCDPFKSWRRIYEYDPSANRAFTSSKVEETGFVHKEVLGGEVALWTELTDAVALEPRMWPRAAAAGEILWSGKYDTNGVERTATTALVRLQAWRSRQVARGLRMDVVQMQWCEMNPGSC